jgi:hypothetical protein
MMNDTPSYFSAWGPAHSRSHSEDERRSEELRIKCGLHLTRETRLERHLAERLAVSAALARAREERRKRPRPLSPKWPAWAVPLALLKKGFCAGCGNPLHYRNATRMCGKCSTRAGRDAPRLRLALAEHLASHP